MTCPFPMPGTPGDILPVTGGLSRQEIFATLTAKPAIDSFVVGDNDPGMRLLVSDGWFFKTHPDRKLGDILTLVSIGERLKEAYGGRRCWHPSKQWFVLFDGEEPWLCNLCRYLPPLPELPLRLRVVGKLYSLLYVAYSWLRHRILLDPSRSNYGLDRVARRFYYLDDQYARKVGRSYERVSPSRLIEAPRIEIEGSTR